MKKASRQIHSGSVEHWRRRFGKRLHYQCGQNKHGKQSNWKVSEFCATLKESHYYPEFRRLFLYLSNSIETNKLSIYKLFYYRTHLV